MPGAGGLKSVGWHVTKEDGHDLGDSKDRMEPVMIGAGNFTNFSLLPALTVHVASREDGEFIMELNMHPATEREKLIGAPEGTWGGAGTAFQQAR